MIQSVINQSLISCFHLYVVGSRAGVGIMFGRGTVNFRLTPSISLIAEIY